VNTSVTKIEHTYNFRLDESHIARINELLARIDRLRHLFLFDARKMLISVMCTDWCGVVWPYLLDSADKDVGIVAPNNIETLRAEFAAVVEERRRRAASAARLVGADVDDKGGSPVVKRRRTKL
jgi:hypothetical protein